MGVSQGFESYNYNVNQWFAWHDSFLLSHHFKLFPNIPKSTKSPYTALSGRILSPDINLPPRAITTS